MFDTRYYHLSSWHDNAFISNYTFLYLITLAGLPTTTALSGTSLTTTAPAPIVTLLPIDMSPMMAT